MEARLAKVELAMADTREGVDLIEQGMETGLEDLREQIQDLRKGVLGSQVQPVSHKEFMSFQDKVMTMFASVESRMDALVTRMETQDQEIRQELAIYKIAVSASLGRAISPTVTCQSLACSESIKACKTRARTFDGTAPMSRAMALQPCEFKQ